MITLCEVIRIYTVSSRKLKKEVTTFLERHSQKSFNHSVRLFRGLRDGSIALDSSLDSPTPNHELLPTYQIRLNRARSQGNESFANDVARFVSSLERRLDGGSEMWFFSDSDSNRFWVFVESDSQEVLGCLLIEAPADATLNRS